ncbi:type II toxin-antitoxin system VapB family antitoxin [Microbispora sp. NBC_01389]|uniref:type II toxin-antitoxin system VapB family antitoxin n=1 Tax=Microbispora sp. NBC_01389 TaxID=2903584 RepID=UPI0032551862
MTRIAIELDDDMVVAAMRIYGTSTQGEAVRTAMEEAVKRHLRLELAEAIKSGELDLSEIVEKTGPRDADG